jgi:phosphonopyruvate decarboxylase
VLSASALDTQLVELGYRHYAGVPCSSMKGLIDTAIGTGRYLIASNEGDAVAIAAGMYLGGARCAVLMQNSGLTNACSPFTSLTHTFEIPVLSCIGYRGEQPERDEPQHALMGSVTPALLDLLQIEWALLSSDPEEARLQLLRAHEGLARHRSQALLVREGLFEPVAGAVQTPPVQADPVPPPQTEPARRPGPLPRRLEVLRALVELAGDQTALVATTGKTGRELYTLADRPGNFYMIGSMGCVASLGLGIALARPERPVVVLDGDGSLLMRLGALASVAAYAPRNLLHIVLDNGTHDSTGGQPTLSPALDLVGAARALGYRRARSASDLDELVELVRGWQMHGLAFLHLRIAPGSMHPLGRPDVRPPEQKARFMRFLAGEG